MSDDPEFRRLVWYLLGGTRGGENRAKIIHELRKRPSNLNQIASKLNLDYRAVRHHVDVLLKNSMVVTQGERYGVMYFLAPWLEAHIALFDEVCKGLNFELE